MHSCEEVLETFRLFLLHTRPIHRFFLHTTAHSTTRSIGIEKTQFSALRKRNRREREREEGLSPVVQRVCTRCTVSFLALFSRVLLRISRTCDSERMYGVCVAGGQWVLVVRRYGRQLYPRQKKEEHTTSEVTFLALSLLLLPSFLYGLLCFLHTHTHTHTQIWFRTHMQSVFSSLHCFISCCSGKHSLRSVAAAFLRFLLPPVHCSCCDGGQGYTAL